MFRGKNASNKKTSFILSISYVRMYASVCVHLFIFFLLFLCAYIQTNIYEVEELLRYSLLNAYLCNVIKT